MRVDLLLLVLAMVSTGAARATIAVARHTTPIHSQWDGVYTDDQANRGRLIYGTRCVGCHGTDLKGVPLPMTRLGHTKNELVPLVGDAFSNNWHRTPLAHLKERIRISMPQDQPGSLSRSQVAAVLAFMLQEGGYPAGDAELSGNSDEPAGVLFLKMRP